MTTTGNGHLIAPDQPADWRQDGECTRKDPELFYPMGNTDWTRRQEEEAKEVCRGCGVQEQCLAFALDTQEPYGVWGGLTEDERRALKRRNDRARRAS